uniref:DNA/RNA non-specific endonuclease/pyrophosphatase/phosphodiesterase domain-containing protein n=1 Tax=Erpetoichthys calabaricus TaxID=27687 RepID=A0A8C4TA69_ERPCA
MPGVLLLDLFLLPDRRKTMPLLVLVILGCLTTQGNFAVMSGQTFTCNNFFHKAMEPMGLIPPKAAQICQTYTNRIYFATIYDQEHRIPISSAYLYNKGGKNCVTWASCWPGPITLGESQAVSEDDKNIYHYDQGHLSPCMHHTDEGKKIAMFTLTNVVPEFKELKNKDHLWTAACCVDQNESPVWFLGYIAENNKNEVEPISFKDLQDKLNKVFNGDMHLFKDECSAKPNNEL